jgi:hypothetical protein
MHSSDLALEVIRGDRPVADMSRLGISMSVTPDHFSFDAPLSLDSLAPSLDDVASGFLAHLSDQRLLREWATVVLGAEFIDLIALENDADGEAIIEGLWAVSTGEPLAPSTMRAVAAVLSRRNHV